MNFKFYQICPLYSLVNLVVRHVEVTTVRQYKDGKISVINDRSLAYEHLTGKEFEKWINGTELKVIAITGI